jgi:hypothetical protein
VLARFREEWASLDPADSDLGERIAAFKQRAEETGDEQAMKDVYQLETNQAYESRLWKLHNQVLWMTEVLVVLAERLDAVEAKDS